jgi:hypothetical protein
MSQIFDYYTYRVWCNTDSKWEEVVLSVPTGDPEPTAPTTCPTDTGHTIDTNQTTINNIQLADTVVVGNTPQVYTEKPMDTLYHIYAHDFCKPWTWYMESTLKTDEIHNITGTPTTVTLGEATPIWLKGRDLMNSHLISTYDFDVRVNDVAKTEQDYVHYKNLYQIDGGAEDWSQHPGDYYYDRENNNLVFHTPLVDGDVVKITYYYVDNTKSERSRFRVQSPASHPNHYVKIETIEVDFSTDIKLRDTAVFQLWAGGGASLQMDKRYYKMDNYRADSVRPNPATAACGGVGERGMNSDGRTYTWDYISAFPIKSSLGMWLDIFLEYNEAFGGDNATVTLYTKLIPE